MQPKQSIIHLPVYQPGKPIEEVQREYGLTEVIKLASNENPFGCSPKAKEAIAAELEKTSLYPDGAAVELTEALAARFGVNTNQIILGAGSDEIILMIARAFLVKGDETVMASHTFSQYRHNCQVEDVNIIEVPLTEGKHDLPAMLAKIGDRTKIVWVCNPNNPTGTIVTRSELTEFLQKVPPHVLVVLDEAYVEYVTDPEFPDGLAFLPQYKNVIVLRTFSKIYGLASLRVGYGIGHPDVIRAINQVRPPFNTSRYGQAAAKAALQDQEFIASCKEKNAQGIQYLTGEFKRLGLPYFPAHGNFIMFDVKRPAKEVFEALLKKGVIVRGGHALDFPTKIRVTVGSAEQNAKFVSALEQVLAEVHAQV